MDSRRTKRSKKKPVLTLLNWDLFVVYSVSATQRIFLANWMPRNYQSNHVLKTSLIGDVAKPFKKRVQYFLDNDLVTCVASDMHNLSKRNSYMQEAFTYIEKEYGRDRARALFKKNPLMLLKN